jgi:F0F1-type ATP synthase membrane subunit b/b'
MGDRKALEKKLDQINTRIDEAEARLGAHSIKPILMQQLFELEEERAAILEQLQRLIKETSPEYPQ